MRIITILYYPILYLWKRANNFFLGVEQTGFISRIIFLKEKLI